MEEFVFLSFVEMDQKNSTPFSSPYSQICECLQAANFSYTLNTTHTYTVFLGKNSYFGFKKK